MPILVSCECGKQFRSRDEWAGRRVKCPNCGAVLTIPGPRALRSEPRLDPADAYELGEPRPSAPAKAPTRAVATKAPAVRASPALPRPSGGGLEFRRWLYLGLVLALLPLAASTFSKSDDAIAKRTESTFSKASPKVTLWVAAIKDRLNINGPLPAGLLPHLPKRFYAELPSDRIEGAFLPRETWVHWFLALVAAAAFFGAALLMLPAASAKPQHAFFTGLFTGTAGVLLLLAVQFIAAWMRGRVIIPRSVIGLFFLILKGIQLSYDAANDPESNFFLSALGFTFGVGLCEELCKALPLLWHYRTKATLDWRGACLWGFLSGVGFGVSEAIMYCGDYYNGISSGNIYLVRFISCVALHGIWAAAAGIFICKHQNVLQDAQSWYNVFFSSAALVAVPMVLHGFYDTMLKKDMNGAALVVALISFGWLVFQIEQARRSDPKPARAYA